MQRIKSARHGVGQLAENLLAAVCRVMLNPHRLAWNLKKFQMEQICHERRLNGESEDFFNRATRQRHEGNLPACVIFVVLRLAVRQALQKNSLRLCMRVFALFEKSVTLNILSAGRHAFSTPHDAEGDCGGALFSLQFVLFSFIFRVQIWARLA
ncbi:MAG: hypothetical protein ONB48_21290 [candidate division KSB1 bacterium]|nr:hypothetical protein [candidate division KSB1 bacterium]MDZ7288183.1 hypothetical protein [candidate division KSB1 bacterium]MDZ7300304.1 hypothetical protein [candidate division KSB1 bacterium]MDZ7308725.1 hypothetical protein [candidate division KSB1 bacterium]MDZ7351304.1 hypothetical protein [candidate division KSB1 bacterium]